MNTLFGTKHLLLIAASSLLILVLYILNRKRPIEQLFKPLLVLGIVSEFMKVFYYILANEAEYGGILPKTDLPFHLCSIQILFFLLLAYSNSSRLTDILLSFMAPSCLFGGSAAIFIATNSSLNGHPILTLQYFGYHCAIVFFALVLLRSQRLTARHYTLCLKFLPAVFLFAIYINSMLFDGNSSINFMYVASPPQGGLPYLNEDHGWLVYICHYAGLVLFCITLCYIKPIAIAISDRLRNKDAVPV